MGIQTGFTRVKVRVLGIILMMWYSLRILFTGGNALVRLHAMLSEAIQGMGEQPRKKYVVGFLFEIQPNGRPLVLLIKKKKPRWQDGAFNGVGGKVKHREPADMAMSREFKEEAGMHIPAHKWRQYCHMNVDNPEKSGLATVYFFTCTVPYGGARDVQQMEEERLAWHDQSHLEHLTIIDNLMWLVPLAHAKLHTQLWGIETTEEP